MSNRESGGAQDDSGVTQDYEIAETGVNADELFPTWNGVVPLYPDHPPDTHLPMWRCPCCGESGPTMKDLWRLYKRREQLLGYKNECEYPSDEWTAYNDGIQETNRRISRISWALPPEVAGWIRRQVEPRRWDESELNPANYGGGSNE